MLISAATVATHPILTTPLPIDNQFLAQLIPEGHVWLERDRKEKTELTTKPNVHVDLEGLVVRIGARTELIAPDLFVQPAHVGIPFQRL